MFDLTIATISHKPLDNIVSKVPFLGTLFNPSVFLILLTLLGWNSHAWAKLDTANSSVPATAEHALPHVNLPRLSSIEIRINEGSMSKKELEEFGFKKAEDIQAIRNSRDEALKNLAATDLKGNLSEAEFTKIALAVTAVNYVCGLGSDYIQYRLKKNSNTQFWTNIVTGIFGATTVVTPIITTAKFAGIAGLLSTGYKTDVVENGDAGHSNAELKKILADVRTELAAGVQNYNRALLMPAGDDKEKLAQYRHLQAAVFEMNTACAFF